MPVTISIREVEVARPIRAAGLSVDEFAGLL
jgi:hypothetical protein